MKFDLTRFTPPGYSCELERAFFRIGLFSSAIYSAFFFIRFGHALDNLYGYEDKRRVLLPDAVMPDFVDLLEQNFIGFALLAALMLCFIAVRYAYYRQGSRADYLMRRLPDRMDRHRRCLLVPLFAALSCAAAAAVLLLVYFAVYMLLTPAGCLQPGQWTKIWRNFL